jgi:DNA-3-methyladenine glycosylase
MRLPHEFISRHVVEVAQDLIGKTLVWNDFRGIITETEAYRGADDEASHAFRGPTPRNKVMFGPPGRTYVYLSYGVHHCLNITSETEGTAAGVLIRGLKLEEVHLNGPGKLCRHLHIDRSHNGLDLVTHSHIYVEEGIAKPPYVATRRIGISKAMDKEWRFLMNGV